MLARVEGQEVVLALIPALRRLKQEDQLSS
jgi:hypothetical protein